MFNLKGETKSKLIKNFISLTSAEFIGKFLGFIALAYLARVISPESFGVIAFTTALVGYFLIFVNLGFDVISLKEISKDHSLVTKYASNILSIRVLISIFLFMLLVVLAISINKPITVKISLLIYGLTLFVNAISLDFIFQSLERFKYNSYKIIGRNLIYLSLILSFVKNDNDIYIVLVFMVLSSFILSIWHFHQYKIQFGIFHLNFNLIFVKNLIMESYPLLFSVIMATIYGSLDMVMLGFIKSNYDVGIYNASYKLFLIAILPLNILLRVSLPMLSRFNLTNRFKKNLLNFILSMILMGLVIMFPLFFLSKYLLGMIFGVQYLAAVVPLKILAINGIVVSLSIAFGNPLTVWGKQKFHAIALTAGAICNIALNLFLIPTYSYDGAAFATLFSEIVVFISLLMVFTKSTKELFKVR